MEEEDDQEALNKAILQSLQSNKNVAAFEEPQVDDDDLKRAISMSLGIDNEAPSPLPQDDIQIPGDVESIEFIRQRRLLRLGQSINKLH